MSSSIRHRGVLPIVLLGLAIAASPAAAQDNDISLEVGEQTTLSAQGVERFSEGAPGIVDVRVTEEDFIIVALREGQTSLLLIYENGRQVRYRISVTPAGGGGAAPGSVQARENIRLDLYFVELNETYSHQIGIAFPASIGGGTANTRFTGNLTYDFIGTAMSPGPSFTTASLALANQVLPRLDLAESSGWARLRQQAMVVTANGTPATLDTGGEVNVQVSTGFSTTLRRIPFGAVLRMTPRYDANSGRIEIQLNADLSELTDPYIPGGPPGRHRTQLESVVNLQPGQALIMSGVVSRSESETQGGLPGLSQIPIVGVLFGTNARSGRATQNFLFIVPTIVQAVPRQQRDYIHEALETFSRFTGHIHDIELFDNVPPGYGAPGGQGPATPAAQPSLTGRGRGRDAEDDDRAGRRDGGAARRP